MLIGEQSANLTTLAKSKAPADRERLLLAVVDLCEGVRATNPSQVSGAQAAMGALFMNLVVEAERNVRQRLAARIADADWAPPALVHALALDEIEIARPIIASSPLLQDKDLVQLLLQATLDHQVEIARRHNIGAPVVDAIVDRAEPTVMTALAGNDTADIQPAAMARLVEESRKSPALRSPLARHPRLTPDLAERLYAWVGDSLKSAILDRFDIDGAALDLAIAETVRGVHDSPAADRPIGRGDMEFRLVDKLYDADQLRPGYLLRALRESKLTLFRAALAKLAGLTADDISRSLASHQPDLLALACMAAGIDRSVFPSVLNLVRQLNGGLPGGGGEGLIRYNRIFTEHTQQNAAAALRQAIGAV